MILILVVVIVFSSSSWSFSRPTFSQVGIVLCVAVVTFDLSVGWDLLISSMHSFVDSGCILTLVSKGNISSNSTACGKNRSSCDNKNFQFQVLVQKYTQTMHFLNMQFLNKLTFSLLSCIGALSRSPSLQSLLPLLPGPPLLPPQHQCCQRRGSSHQ